MSTGNIVEFVALSYNTFVTLTSKDSDTLYYITDKGWLFKGEVSYSSRFQVLGSGDSFPTVSASWGNCLYVKPSTGEARTYVDGVEIQVCLPWTTSVSSTSTDLQIPTAKAVYSHVSSTSSSLASSIATKMDTLASGTGGVMATVNTDGSVARSTISADDVAELSDLNGLIKSISYASGNISLTFYNNSQQVISLGASDVFTDVSFNPDSGVLTLYFTDAAGDVSSESVDLTTLIDIYDGRNGQYIPDAEIQILTYEGGKSYSAGNYVYNSDGSIVKLLSDTSAPFDSTVYTTQTVHTLTSDSVFGIVSDHLLLLNGVYYAIPDCTGATSSNTIAELLYTRPVSIYISDYAVSAELALDSSGHLKTTSNGVAVNTTSSISNSSSTIPTAQAVYNHVSSAKAELAEDIAENAAAIEQLESDMEDLIETEIADSKLTWTYLS